MRLSLLALVPLVQALDFQWTYQGERYHATETCRLPVGKDTAEIVKLIGPNGIGYMSVGKVAWPQFNMSIASSTLSPGAYTATNLGSQLVIARAYQVKADPAIAFMEGVLPTDDGSFSAFQGGGIPIPPRVTGSGPLASLRFAVKDIFHVKGVKTSGGSRAYYSVYGPQNYTTETVAKSVAGGAQLVGKTKTIAFALGTPQNGWEVDYQDPWNFRNDGYQTTGGSSSGSGSAIVAYDWIDFTIGSDTGGSVRFPARDGGFYGYKPTHGVYNLTGILVAIAEQDTPGFMARSPEVFGRVYKQWSSGTKLTASPPTAFPKRLQYWSDETLVQPEAQAMVRAFFSKVESALNMTSFSQNTTALWVEKSGINQTRTDYLFSVYADQNSAQAYDQIGKDLIKRFGEMNDGAFPPADPMVNLTWADGVNSTSRGRLAESVRRRLAYAEWHNKYLLPASQDGTCTSSIVAHSLHKAPNTVKYDQNPFGLAYGFYNDASYAGTPEIIVPIGQIQYYSHFTLKMEWQAVTVAFSVAKGCDTILFQLVEKLAGAGLIKEVMSGKTAYPVAK